MRSLRGTEDGDIEDIVGFLNEKSPVTQIVLGSVILVGGLVGFAFLHEVGLIWGVPIAAIVIGAFALGDGCIGLRRQRSLEAQAQLVLEHREEIIQEVIAAKASGGNTVALLQGKGITDTRIRQAVLREARERMAEAEEPASV